MPVRLLKTTSPVLFSLVACATADPVTVRPAQAPRPAARPTPAPAPRQAPGPVISRLIAPSFSVPLPAGFGEYNDPEHEAIYEAGGLILGQSERPALEEAFQASIVITALPNKNLDLRDSILCLSIGQNAADSLGGTVLGVKRHKRGSGPTCQVLVKPSAGGNKLSRAEVLGDGERSWIVTCNYDRRDKAALQSCDQVTDGFQPLQRLARAP
jgi:hypothetical protein